MAGLGEGSLDGAAAPKKKLELRFFPLNVRYKQTTAHVPFLVHLQECEKPRDDLKDREDDRLARTRKTFYNQMFYEAMRRCTFSVYCLGP